MSEKVLKSPEEIAELIMKKGRDQILPKKISKTKKELLEKLSLPKELAAYAIDSLDLLLKKEFKLDKGLYDDKVRFLDYTGYREGFLKYSIFSIYKTISQINGFLGDEIVNKEFYKTINSHILKHFFAGNVGELHKDKKKIKVDDKKLSLLVSSSIVFEEEFEEFVRFMKWKFTEIKEGAFFFVTNSEFIDSTSLSKLRKDMLDMFNDIYVYNFHGGLNKKSFSPGRGADENILELDKDIVCCLLVKKPYSRENKIIHYKNIWGQKSYKLEALKEEGNLHKTKWRDLTVKDPYWFFTKKDTRAAEEYIKYWDLVDIIPNYGKDMMREDDFINFGFNIGEIDRAIEFTSVVCDSNQAENNILRGIFDKKDYIFPFFVESNELYFANKEKKKVNINPMFIELIEKKLKLSFVEENEGDLIENFGIMDLFYYIYSIFYCPSYRKRYSEQLEVDFPRIPLIKDNKLFKKLVRFGNRLSVMHFLGEHPLYEGETVFDDYSQWNMGVGGSDKRNLEDWKITAIYFDEKKERVYVNSSQYFEGISKKVWNYNVGAYRVLEQWLLKRKRENKALDVDLLKDFLKLAVSIRETVMIMKEIDEAIGKWPIK